MPRFILFSFHRSPQRQTFFQRLKVKYAIRALVVRSFTDVSGAAVFPTGFRETAEVCRQIFNATEKNGRNFEGMKCFDFY